MTKEFQIRGGLQMTRPFQIHANVVEQFTDLGNHVVELIDLRSRVNRRIRCCARSIWPVWLASCTAQELVQRHLGVIGDRYGIEPDGGSPPVFDLARIVRLAEEILETSVAAPAGVIPAAVADSTRTEHSIAV